MKRKLLENLQEACRVFTEDYQEKTNNRNIQFCVLQLANYTRKSR